MYIHKLNIVVMECNVKTLTLVVANGLSWEDLKVMILEEYCPRSEMQKL